jgi:hypothetical protein
MMYMKKTIFTDEQIIGFLRLAEAGMPIRKSAAQTDSASRPFTIGANALAAWRYRRGQTTPQEHASKGWRPLLYKLQTRMALY